MAKLSEVLLISQVSSIDALSFVMWSHSKGFIVQKTEAWHIESDAPLVTSSDAHVCVFSVSIYYECVVICTLL